MNFRKDYTMKKTELLSPAGNFDCLVAAVQNGADSVYFGSSFFSARAYAGNFEGENLEKAIDYAKTRNVKTHLTLNTLIKEEELDDAIGLANTAYSYGIDAIIVQDLGLATFLIKHCPHLPIHASTQMSIHNLQDALAAEKLGFQRIVLARELSLDEISQICKQTKLEVETFIHGALCISYSGQCLFSSMVGARSGNRGKCAQACRLPYELLQDNKLIDKGYLLSPRDVCGLHFVPSLMQAGVDCFKIEGRMKSPEYVATVTRIYRKYIDKVLNHEEYVIDDSDMQDLLQVFNRGGFSDGHLNSTPNRNIVFPEKPNNMGIYLGEISSYQASKGHITLKLKDSIAIGDTISISSEEGSYTVSELMKQNKNVSFAEKNEIVTLGRMKGKISKDCKVYRLSTKELSTRAKLSFADKDAKKIPLYAKLVIKHNSPIMLTVQSAASYPYQEPVTVTSDITPEIAKSSPISLTRIKQQLCKTGNTSYQFVDVAIDLDDNLFLPLSAINELRRMALEKFHLQTRQSYKHALKALPSVKVKHASAQKQDKKISVLLNQLDTQFDYTTLQQVYRFYIPLHFFVENTYQNALDKLCHTCKVYIYLPNILRKPIENLIDQCVSRFPIAGFVISHIGQIDMLKKYGLDLVGNYTFNVFNSQTASELQSLGLSCYTVSPELEKSAIASLLQSPCPAELFVYGRVALMTSHYCLLR